MDSLSKSGSSYRDEMLKRVHSEETSIAELKLMYLDEHELGVKADQVVLMELGKKLGQLGFRNWIQQVWVKTKF